MKTIGADPAWRSFSATFLLLVLAVRPAARTGAAETVIIDDALQGRSTGELYGGAFSAEGYQPREKQGHILYRLPGTVVEGYLEVEVKGMTRDVPPASNHAFLAMYDGRGIQEPAIYADDYKENFYRWNAHWRASHGAFKCVVQCSAPTPERLNAARAVFPRTDGEARDWRAEPTGKPFAWNPERWHRLRVEWGRGRFSVRVDGTEVWAAAEAPYDYAPREHRVWLGSAPGYSGKYENELPGITYRNFKLVALRTLPPPTNTNSPSR